MGRWSKMLKTRDPKKERVNEHGGMLSHRGGELGSQKEETPHSGPGCRDAHTFDDHISRKNVEGGD